VKRLWDWLRRQWLRLDEFLWSLYGPLDDRFDY